MFCQSGKFFWQKALVFRSSAEEQWGACRGCAVLDGISSVQMVAFALWESEPNFLTLANFGKQAHFANFAVLFVKMPRFSEIFYVRGRQIRFASLLFVRDSALSGARATILRLKQPLRPKSPISVFIETGNKKAPEGALKVIGWGTRIRT